jgi:hypothetical protein
VFPSDLPGVNPATLNGILLYYRLMTKWSGLGDSTELSRVGLSHCNKLILTRVVLWTHLRVSFNAYVDPLYEFQLIYWALTRQLTTG